MSILKIRKTSNERGATAIENLAVLTFILLLLAQALMALGPQTRYGFFRAAVCLGGGTDIINSALPTDPTTCETGLGVVLPTHSTED